MRRVAPLVAFTGVLLPAQTTWTVDASGAGSFTTIAAAIQAANDGDLILVRPTAIYNWTTTVSKRLAIVGDGLTHVVGTLAIANLRSDQRLVVANFWESNPVNASCITATNCAGHVILSNVQLTLLGNSAPAVSLTDAVHVAIHGSNVQGGPPIRSTRSTLTASSSSLVGNSGQPYLLNTYPAPGILAINSRIEVSNSMFSGGSLDMFGLSSGAAEPGLRLQGSNVIFAGGSAVGGTANSPGTNGASILMDNLTSVTADVSAQFPNGISGGVATIQERGCISGTLPTPGGAASFTMNGYAGGLGALAIALPGGPTPVAQGMVWLDPASCSVLALGAVPVTGHVSVPANVLRGTAVSLQGVLLYGGTVTLSPPLVDAVH